MIDPTITIPQTFQTHGSIRSPAAGLVASALIGRKIRTLKARVRTADASRVLGVYAAIPFGSFDLAFSAGVGALLLVSAVAARVIISRRRPPVVLRPARVPPPPLAEAETDEREAVAAG
jgi:hypothetical protein